LIERLFGNLSGQVQELLPGAIRSGEPKALRQAAQEACLLYEDLYRFFQKLIVVYQHTFIQLRFTQEMKKATG
jgi:hypothetical protein